MRLKTQFKIGRAGQCRDGSRGSQRSLSCDRRACSTAADPDRKADCL